MYSEEPPAYLPRGGACVVCRKKKTKCHGEKPVCSSCVRSGMERDCVYDNTPAPNIQRDLERQIAELDGRIQGLMQRRGPEASRTASRNSPPPEAAQNLTNYFLPHALKLGCVLDLKRAFSHSHTMPASNALRTAVYLWGIKLSGDANYLQHEQDYLTKTLRAMQAALSWAQQNQLNTLHLIQAEILVANYFFSYGRWAEGQAHTTAMVSLALASGLHKLPPPVQNLVEEVEKINVWWTVFSMENWWSALLDVPSRLMDSGESALGIDTPWAQAVGAPFANESFYGQTVFRFLSDVRTGPASSPLSLQAQSAVLLAMSAEVASYQGQGDPQQFVNMFSALDQSLEMFKRSLPVVARTPPLPLGISHDLLIAHSLVHAATIRMYKGFITTNPEALPKCLSASFAIIELITTANVRQMNFVHPVVAMLWGTACEIIVNLLSHMRRSPPSRAASGLPGPEALQASLRQLASAMSQCAGSVPLFGSQLEKLQHLL
ncbi:hypothetical protein BDW22DRAFT_1428702 [Trametopsis cervina]|nr:hypothetical protein BDW22DRAFT_1428702 [Trametopsis cervina]